MSTENRERAATGTLPDPGSGMSDSSATGAKHVSRPRRGISFWIGLLLVLGGLGMLGYVAWQFYGTNIVSKQQQQQTVDDLTSDWTVGQPRSLEGETKQVPLGDAMALVRIPAFGDDYVIPVLEGIGDGELSRGYGHFPETAAPGKRGNFALAAHRITHGEPLRDMPELRPGDEIVVETRDRIFTYELDTNPNDLIVTFEDIWVIDPVPSNPDGGVQPPSQEPGQKLITLTTCAELFHTDDRMIAFGHLVDTERK